VVSVGGVTTLFTVTVMVAEVVVFPAASLATAVRVWAALELLVVFQTLLNGETVSSAPRLTPSSLNWTPTTPTLSAAVAEMVVAAPDTVALLAGAVTDTVGATPSVTVRVKVVV
jgi:hypothetical protein